MTVKDYVVITTKIRRVADDIAGQINALGMWDAVVRPHDPVPNVPRQYDVLIPGISQPDLPKYMIGFIDGWMMSLDLLKKRGIAV